MASSTTLKFSCDKALVTPRDHTMKIPFLLALAVVTCTTQSPAAAKRPNFIVILVDDMGFSDIGYGSEIPTPNINSLANNGVRFSQFYNTGRCCPTRTSLLTGLYSHQAGVGWMTADQGIAGYRGRLNNQCVTIAEVLGEAGYFTAMTGKWHVGFNHGVTPWGRGFHRSLNTPAGGLHFSNQTGPKGGTKLYLNGQEVARDHPQFNPPWYGSDLWTDQGIKFIDEAIAERKPFFLYLAHIAPHFPCMAPEKTIAKYRGKYMEGWDKLREDRYARQIEAGLIDPHWKLEPRPDAIPAWDSLSPEQQTRYDDMMAIYAAMIDEIDKNVGKLVTALREKKQLDNTLILFMSDNGGNAEAGVKGKYQGRPSRRSALGCLHRPVLGSFEQHTVPQVQALQPRRRHRHATDRALARRRTPRRGGRWDHNPRASDRYHGDVRRSWRGNVSHSFQGHAITPSPGQSLAPLLTGKGHFAPRALFWEHEGNAAIRVGDRKLVRQGLTGKWELFDMKADRTEQNNLADDHPEEVAALTKQWEHWAKTSNVLPQTKRQIREEKKGMRFLSPDTPGFGSVRAKRRQPATSRSLATSATKTRRTRVVAGPARVRECKGQTSPTGNLPKSGDIGYEDAATSTKLGWKKEPLLNTITIQTIFRIRAHGLARTKRSLRHVAVLALCMAVGFPCLVSTGQCADRPNIIVIMADDLGFSDVGCYGGEISTPNLDALAADGLRFSQFYNTAKCHSSRVSLLTGQYCLAAGDVDMTHAVTSAEVLHNGGYFTAMTGKWHLHQQPTDFGFDRYFGHLSGACNYFFGDKTFRLNGEPWKVPENGFYTTVANVDFALKFLKEARATAKPWYLYVAFNAPHAPLQALPEDYAKYKGVYNQGWDQIREARVAKQKKIGLLPKDLQPSPRPESIPEWESLRPRAEISKSKG